MGYRAVLIGSVGLGLTSLANPLMAQSILPTANTQVEQRGPEYSITGGEASADGVNLFHGFERFTLEAGERANFWVPAGVANVLGRVSGGEVSLINGQLQLLGSPADLFLLNPAGIVFGEEATLALPGNFLATTADSILFEGGTFPAVGSAEYAQLVGEPTGLGFGANAGGVLINSGDLAVAPGASLSLVGSGVVNTGSLTSPEGSVTLAAVPAGGGYVRLSAMGSVLSYEVVAQRLTTDLKPLDLPGLLTDTSMASATGLAVNADGSITLAGADVTVTAGTVLSSGDVTGGNLQFLGDQVGALTGQIVAADGGNIWFGGNREGVGPLPNARAIYVGPSANVTADARSGNGGNIFFWSEESSRIYGGVSARGGDQGGDGGFIETSSRGFLQVSQAPDVSAALGAPGLWLLDPFDIEIRDNDGANVNLPMGSPFTATGSVAVLDVNLLNQGLTNGSVVVSTGSGGADNGSITLIDPLTYSASPGASLTLSAAGNISINSAIAPQGATPLNLLLRADTDGQGNGVVTIADDVLINTAGGNLEVNGNGTQLSSAAGVSLLAGSTLQTNGGNLSINGRHGSGPGVLVETGTQLNSGTGSINITGISNTGIGIDLRGDVETTSSTLTLDGRTSNITGLAIQVGPPINDNAVRINAVGDIETNTIEARTDIDITTTNFLRVTDTNGAGQSLSAPGGITIRHGGDGQTPFVVGDAGINGTAGAISADNTITPIRSFSETFIQGNISILTTGDDPTDCIDGCNDLIDDDLGDDEFTDGDFAEDDVLDDSLSGDPLAIEDGEGGGEGTDGEDNGADGGFDDGDGEGLDENGGDDGEGFEDSDEDDGGEALDSEEGDKDGDEDDGEDDEFDDEEFDDDEFDYEDDVFFEILDDAEITAEELAGKERTLSQEYAQYLGVQVDRTLPLPEVQQQLDQVAIATGYTPAIVYIDFVADDRPQSKQVLELNQDNHLLELVLVTADAPSQRLLIETTKADVQRVVAQFQRGIVNQSFGRRYLRPAQRLHSWLISPLEERLRQQNISHLAFVLPSGLRSLPLAALHDGDSFLIERYSLGIMPSVGLTNIDYSDIRSVEVLAAGASTFLDQPDLPAVPLELKTITETLWPGRFFLNESFTPERVLVNRQRGTYGILHLATHGEFRPGSPSNSYIQFWDRRLTLNQLSSLSLNDPPVDLLVLSACRTALGSREAELGFAGLAVQAGVKTAMASLWQVDDVGTAGLMTEFYANLRNSTMRAEALRQAQIAMIQGNVTVEAGQLNWTGGTLTMPPALAEDSRLVLSHPFYWAAFTLIGSPW